MGNRAGKIMNNRKYRLLLRTSLQKDKKVGQCINMKIADAISFVIAGNEHVLSDSDLLKEFMRQDQKVSLCL